MTKKLLDQAFALHQAGQLAQAEALYRQALAGSPENFQLQYRLALLLFQQQRHGEALACITAALAFHPDAVEGLMLQGALLAAALRHKEALARFDRALALKPDFPGALYNRGLALVEMGRSEEGVAAFDRFLALSPDSAEAWSNRGAALQRLGQSAEALASYDKAITLAQGHAPAWQNRGTAMLLLGRFGEALECFDRVLALAARHAGAWRGRGTALMGLERFGEALDCLDKSLAIAPGDPAVLQQRAAVRETIQLFDALPTKDNEIELLHQRAAVLQVTQRFVESLAALDKALAIEPQNPTLLSYRGVVLCEAGRVPEGVEVFRRHAELVFGGIPVSEPEDLPHKKRHDAEQRAWLAGQGINDDGFRLEAGARTSGPAVNPANAEEIARRWQDSRPQIVVIDNLLTPEALAGLQRFCWGSTVWRRPYAKGYLGAMPDQGFACPLLAQIADELRQVFPSIIGQHGLRKMWGFKYDSSLSGIPMHADQAAVNVNFWIAPDEANRDPHSGGLVVWDVKAPLDWDFQRYNVDADGIKAFLKQKNAKPITIPHRANRAVVFDSDLFHETDRIDFKEGYLNRRINVTMLYGRRVFFGA